MASSFDVFVKPLTQAVRGADDLFEAVFGFNKGSQNNAAEAKSKATEDSIIASLGRTMTIHERVSRRQQGQLGSVGIAGALESGIPKSMPDRVVIDVTDTAMAQWQADQAALQNAIARHPASQNR